MSALFPKAKIQPTGVTGVASLSSTEVTNGCNHLAGSGASADSGGVSSGIKRCVATMRDPLYS